MFTVCQELPQSLEMKREALPKLMGWCDRRADSTPVHLIMDLISESDKKGWEERLGPGPLGWHCQEVGLSRSGGDREEQQNMCECLVGSVGLEPSGWVVWKALAPGESTQGESIRPWNPSAFRIWEE